MTSLKTLLLKERYIFILLIFFCTLITWPVFLPGYFFHHDDLQAMRVLEMRKCFDDLQIPCRWVPDMGYGNGFPLYNYYSALPYYIGGLLTYFLSFIDASKALFFIPLVLGGFAMYFLGKELYGKLGGFVAGTLYLFAPYRALDAYVRGAVAESFALAIIPFVFLFSLRLIKEKTTFNLVGFVISLGAFLLCHNIMTLFFMPMVFVWMLLLLLKYGKKSLKQIIIGTVLGISLSAFFVFPAYLEKGLVQSETLTSGGSDFRTHFVSVGQIFWERSWGYGGSVFGPNDTISFQIGFPHMFIFVISVILVFFTLIRKKKLDYITLFLIFCFLLAAFMMHNKSTFIWKSIDALRFAQFPWRFLSISIFTVSLLGGYVISAFPKRIMVVLCAITIALAVSLNWQYFQPRDFYPWVNDAHKFSDPLWEIQQKAGIMDYLPVTAYEPFARASENPEILKGKAEVVDFNKKSNSFSAEINVSEKTSIEIPVFDFPNWIVFVNLQKVDHYREGIGRIAFDLEPGNYQIYGKLYDTNIRIISNWLSLISIFLIVLIIVNKRIQKNIL